MSIPREGSRDIDKGILISSYPDWCKVPEKPCPFPLYAKQHEDANTTPTVYQTGCRCHTTKSIITCSHGDEAGIGLGVESGTRGSICQPKTWSETVRFEGCNVVRHNDTWYMNNKNTTGKLSCMVDTEFYKAASQWESIINPKEDTSRYVLVAGLRDIFFGNAVNDAGLAAALTQTYNNSSIENFQNNVASIKEKIEIMHLATQIGLHIAIEGKIPSFINGLTESTQASDLPQEEVNIKTYAEYERDAKALASMREYWARQDEAKSEARYLSNRIINQYNPIKSSAIAGLPTDIDEYGLTEEQRKKLEELIKLAIASNVRVSARAQDQKEDCRVYACPSPLPWQKYMGGSYGCMSKPVGDGLEAHHMPANAYNGLNSKSEGPAIQMLPSHHHETASNSKNARDIDYSAQKALLDQGEFMKAFYLDIIDAVDAINHAGGDPDEYKDAIAQVILYAECLRRTGKVK